MDWKEDMRMWSTEDREEWSERAAMIEYSCKVTREEAEKMAFDYVQILRANRVVW